MQYMNRFYMIKVKIHFCARKFSCHFCHIAFYYVLNNNGGYKAHTHICVYRPLYNVCHSIWSASFINKIYVFVRTYGMVYTFALFFLYDHFKRMHFYYIFFLKKIVDWLSSEQCQYNIRTLYTYIDQYNWICVQSLNEFFLCTPNDNEKSMAFLIIFHISFIEMFDALVIRMT